jgi:hypothetical protein
LPTEATTAEYQTAGSKADTQLYFIGIFDPFEYRSRTPVGWQRFWLWLEHHQGTVGWFCG